MVPWAHMHQHRKRHLDRFSRFYVQPFLRTPLQRLPIHFKAADNPQKLPIPLGGSEPRLIYGSLGPPESASKRRLDQLNRLVTPPTTA